MPAVLAEEICKIFVSAKKRGAGLALSRVKKVVEAHQGVVSLQKYNGTATTFRIIQLVIS